MAERGELKRALRARRRSRLSLGFAAVVVALGAVLALIGWGNHRGYLGRQEQIPRLRSVRATFVDKGVARRESWSRRPDGNWSTRTEETKWVRFTCHAGDDGDQEGTRLTLSGYEREWERFQKGVDYDAH